MDINSQKLQTSIVKKCLKAFQRGETTTVCVRVRVCVLLSPLLTELLARQSIRPLLSYFSQVPC